jgi:hypothetical protein
MTMRTDRRVRTVAGQLRLQAVADDRDDVFIKQE